MVGGTKDPEQTPIKALSVNADTPAPENGTQMDTTTPGRFAGRTIIVTGAGAGIGRATVESGEVAAVEIGETAATLHMDYVARTN